MYAAGPRNIRNGKEYDHLFTPPQGTEVTVVPKSATLDQTLELMSKAVSETTWQTRQIAEVLKGNTRKQSLKNLFDFVYTHFQYKPDKQLVEQIRSPRRSWADRKSGIDCDCYSVFIGSVLSNWGMPFAFRVIRQYGKADYHHVYIIVNNPDSAIDGLSGNYTTLDCVLDTFNQEPYTIAENKDYTMNPMKLTYLDGLGCECSSKTNLYSELGQPAEEMLHLQFRTMEDGTIEATDQYGNDYEVDMELFALYASQGLAGLGELGFLKKVVKAVGKQVKAAVNVAVQTVVAPVKVVTNVVKGENVWEAIKDQGKEFGAAHKELIRSVNVLDPAAAMIRLGLRKVLEWNMFNIARRIRWAYLSDREAHGLGWDMGELKKLRNARDFYEDAYKTMGGKVDNVKKYIYQGKGNRDGKMSTQNIKPVEEYDNNPPEVEAMKIESERGVNGLGEPWSAIAAIVAALATIITTIAKMKGASGPDDCNIDAPEMSGNEKIDKLQRDTYTALETACKAKKSADVIKDLAKSFDKAKDEAKEFTDNKDGGSGKDGKDGSKDKKPLQAGGMNWLMWLALAGGGYALVKGLSNNGEQTEAEKEMESRQKAKAAPKKKTPVKKEALSGLAKKKPARKKPVKAASKPAAKKKPAKTPVRKKRTVSPARKKAKPTRTTTVVHI